MAVLLSLNVAMADQYCFFGYGTSSQTSVLSSNTKAKAAIYVPAEVAARYKGCYINKVRVGLATKANTLTVFVTKDLSGEYAAKGSTTTAFGGTTTDVALDNNGKYEIDGDAFYVGYEIDSDAPAMALSNLYNDNGCWADLGDGWKNYATDPSVKAPVLCIDARIAGTKVPVDANLISPNGAVAAEGEPFAITAMVKNQGYSKITKLGLAYSINGEEEKNIELTKLSILAGKDATVSYTLPENPYKIGVYDLKMRITTVNGNADEVEDNNVGETTLNVLEFVPAKRLFVEEWTGVDCGFCPRGIVGMQTMHENHPSQFVGIAVHCYNYNGPVAPEEYKTFLKSRGMAENFPGCYVQRQSPSQPSASNFEDIYKNLSKIAPSMRVEVESKLSADGNSVEATAFVTPLALKVGVRYKLGFVLTEDDVTGYAQLNNFAGGTYGSMGGWENKGSYVYEPLQHVARAIYGIEGIDGSVPADLTVNKQEEYSVSIPVPSTVQNKSNLKAIAFLVDATTGYVENAAEAKVGDNSVSGINDIKGNAAAAAEAVYNLQGVKVLSDSKLIDTLPAGIYVVGGRKIVNK